MGECYNLVGFQLSNDYGRCISKDDSAVSACCYTAGDTPDICLDSGLCLTISNSSMGLMYENGCTDKTFTSKQCSQVCAGVRNSTWWAAEVLICEPRHWCCRSAADSASCCNDASARINPSDIGSLQPSALSALRNLQAAVTSSSSSSNGTASATTATASTTSSCATSGAISPSSKSSNTTPIVGGVLGGLLFASLLALGAMVWMWRQERRERLSLQGRGAPVEKMNDERRHYSPAPMVEADPTSARHELPGRRF